VASLGLHVVVLGAGAVLGGWGSRALVRAATTFDARLESPPEPPPQVLEDRPEPVLPELDEPELVESDVWSLTDPEPPSPDPAPLRWPTERPVVTGRLQEPPGTEIAADEATPDVEPSPADGAGPQAEELEEIAASPIYAPPPAYPRRSIRAGEQGSVLLRLHLTEAGRVQRVEVLESSGHARLDASARETLATWRFSPRTVGGRAAPGAFDHRVTFELTGSPPSR
jgi:protein TonB